jgi:hypothetical protein
MNRLLLLAAGVAALGLTACHREVRRVEPLRTIARLDCPEQQGQLKRVSAAPDGQACVYQADATEVTLKLLALNNGDAHAALAPIEAELKGLMPAKEEAAAAKADAEADAADKGDDEDDNDAKHEKVSIDFPGLHVKAENGNAEVEVGGVHVDADDNGKAVVKVGDHTTINAENERAEIRDGHDDQEGFHATYILASDKMPSGYHVVGYEARGPKAGPIAVAIVKSRAEHQDRDVFDDMKALVKKNVGG